MQDNLELKIPCHDIEYINNVNWNSVIYNMRVLISVQMYWYKRILQLFFSEEILKNLIAEIPPHYSFAKKDDEEIYFVSDTLSLDTQIDFTITKLTSYVAIIVSNIVVTTKGKFNLRALLPIPVNRVG